MRLTREALIRTARDAAIQRSKVSRRIMCIYLTGSVLDESPLMGGTTDIDLVIIQDSEPVQPREVVRLSDDVHLDIAYYDQAIFHQPRHLRTDPWLGPFIYKKPLVLYDTQHWFDFIQASTGAQFLQPEYAIQRAVKLFQSAREDWMELEDSTTESQARKVDRYLSVIENAGNALASLTGEPICERRFFLNLPLRLQNMQQTEITASMVHLLAPENDQWVENWKDWLLAWRNSYQAASARADAPVKINACRLPYFERAIQALWEENITAALWLLVRTWAITAGALDSNPDVLSGWEQALQALSLDTDSFQSRLSDLDKTLDQVEEQLEVWARSNGVSTIT